MALTITPGGMSASESIPDTIPDSPAHDVFGMEPQAAPALDVDPLEAFGMKPMDWRDDHEKAMDSWRDESTKALDDAALNPKSYQDEALPYGYTQDEWRQTRLVDDWMRLKTDGQEPPMGEMREFVRAQLATKHLGGKGVESDDELFSAITGQAQGRKAKLDLHRDLLDSASIAEVVKSPGTPAMSFDEWRKAAEAKPGFDPEDSAELMDAWYQAQTAVRGALHEFRPQLDAVWGAFTKTITETGAGAAVNPITLFSGGATKTTEVTRQAESAAVAARNAYDALPDADTRKRFVAALSMRAKALPKNEQATFWENMGKQGERDIGGFAVDVAETDPYDAFIQMGLAADNSEGKAAKDMEERRVRDFTADVLAVRDSTYDPVKTLAKDGTWMQALEKGAYAAPGAITSSAMAAVPVVGLPMFFATAKEGAYQNYRQKFEAAGMSYEEARDKADILSTPGAALEVIAERFAIKAFAGKLPFFEKAMSKATANINSFGARMAVRTTAGTLEEGLLEKGQDLIYPAIQDIAHGLGMDVPDQEWLNGKNGALDGFWKDTAGMMVTMLPLAVFGGARGAIADSTRVNAFTGASDLQLQALGVHPDDVAAFRTAAQSGVGAATVALDSAMGNLDPQSEAAKNAVEELMQKAERARQASTALEGIGYSMPSITVLPSGGYVVKDSLTGEEVGRANNSTELDTVIRSHSVALEAMQEDEMRQLATWLGTARVAAKDSGIAQELNLSRRFGMEDVKALGPKAMDRFMTEVALQEQAEGGDGSATRAVFGMNITESRNGVKQVTNKIFAGAHIGTLFHENWHSARSKAKEAGSLSREDDIRFLRAFDTVLNDRRTREVKNADGTTLVPATRMSFLPAGVADEAVSDELLDEAIAEVAEVLTYLFPKNHTTNKHGLTRKVVATFIGTVGRLAPEATGKFSSFVRAIKAKMGLSMSRAYHIKKGIAAGTIDPAGIDDYMGKLFGTDVQQEHDDGVHRELNRILAMQDNVEDDSIPFSVGRSDERLDSSGKSQDIDTNTPGGANIGDRALPGNSAVTFEKNIDDILEVAKAAKTRILGLRVMLEHKDPTPLVKVGDSLEASSVWDDGEPTRRKLVGTSSIGIGLDRDSIREALYHLGVTGGKELPGFRYGYYWGKQVVLITGSSSKKGSDFGERVIRDAKVLAVWEKPDSKARADYLVPSDFNQSTPADSGAFSIGRAQVAEDDNIPFSVGRSDERLDSSGKSQDIDTNTPGGANIGDAALPENSAVTLYRGIDPEASRTMDFGEDGIHFTSDKSYAATFGEVQEVKAALGRNLNLMNIESKADFIRRFELSGIEKETVVGIFIDGPATVSDIANTWENEGPEVLMGEDFTNFLGRFVRDRVDSVTFPENAVEEDPAFIILRKELLGPPFNQSTPADSGASFSIGRAERPFYSSSNVQDLRHDKTAWLADANPRGKGNRDEADEIVSKYYKTAAYAGIPKDAILVAVPSTSGHNILPAALAARISKDFGQAYEKRRIGTATAKGEAKNKRSFFDKESDPVGFIPNEEVLADLKGKRVFITEDVHNTGESWIAFARMLQDHGVNVVGVATLTSTEQRETSARDMERMAEKMAEVLAMPLDEVLPVVHSLFDGTFKQLFNKAEAEISRANQRSNASNARKLFDIATSGRRAGAYSNPLRNTGSGAGDVSRSALSQDTFGFSIGRAQVAARMQGGALALVRDPVRRVQAMARMARDFGDLSLSFQRIEALAGRRRSKAMLKQEANAREDMAAEEKIGSVWAKYGALLADSDNTRTKAQLAHEYLTVKRADGTVDPLHGRLMSKMQAMKKYPDRYALHRGGEYDGSENISRTNFGGTLMPDQAAQELFAAGLLPEPTADALWETLAREQNSVIKNKEALAKALEEIRQAKREAKQEANEWLATQGKEQESHYNPKEEILASLRLLDAILLALPAEIRGKIGGHTQMAQIATDEAKLSFLKDKLKKADRELETFLRESFHREWVDLLGRAKPDKDNPGQRPTGTIDADALDILRAAEAGMWLDFAQGEAEANRLDALAEDENATQDQADKLRATAQMVRLTSNWSTADAARREQAVIEGTRIYYGGLMALRIKNSQRAERLRNLQKDAIQGTGQAGDRMARKKINRAENSTRVGQAASMVWEFLSFGQLANVLFGEKSASAKWFNAREIAASNAYADGMQATVDALEGMFENLSGSRFAGEKLRHRLQTVESITTQDAHGTSHTFTDAEAISFLLMWRQEDGRRHMEGQTDEEGNLVSDWGWTDQAATDIEKQLTPEGKAMFAFLASSYAGEYDRINDVFRRIWNVSMPRHKHYAPLTVKPSMGRQDTIADPVSGDSMGVGMTPGSLKNRSQTAVTEPDFRDAFQVFLQHARQMEHFVTHGEFARDAMAIVNRREIRNSLEAVSPTAAATLSKWIDYFALGGLQTAAISGRFSKFFAGMLSRLSSVALIGRVSVLAMQSLQLAAAAYKMPTGAYLSRFARLTTGQLGWGDAIRSPYIQRRMAEMPPVVRDMIHGMAAGTPNRAKYLATQAARAISGADALFTAGTYAILYDYHLTQARKAGLPDPEKHAHTEAERLTDQVAQPMRTGARSWLEVSSQSQPAMRALWNFSSDPRQKMSLIIYQALRHDVSGKDKALALAKAAAVTWAVSGILQAVVRATLRDLRSGDDDEIFDERHWDLKKLGLMAFTGPFDGIPILGNIIEGVVYNAAGEWKPINGLIDAVASAVPAAERLATGDSDHVIKDIESVLTGGAAFSGTSAAGANAMHVVRDAVGIYENFDGE